MRSISLLLLLLAAVGAAAAAPPASAGAIYAYSLTPQNIHQAYSLPNTGAADQRIAVVSAYDDPGAQQDLSAYSTRFHLPACTMANGCFEDLNQAGATSPLPGPDLSGGEFLTESSAGIQIARGVCQSCSILLVEARSTSKSDLSTAVNTAAAAGATEIVTTFGQAAAPDDSQYATDYSHPSAIVVAASGDTGYAPQANFPASLSSVIAVGGTSLDLTRGGRYQAEAAWSRSTSGCSAYNPAAAWQTALAPSLGCGENRALVDLAAVAEPGALVHITDAGQPGGPWYEVSGTSASAPIIAGVIGLAGGAGSREPQLLYQHWRSDPAAFHDVTNGANSSSCAQSAPICTARPGFDGPTGMGTPNGLAAFLDGGGVIDRRHPHVAISVHGYRLRLSRRWSAQLLVRNFNPFAIHGTIRLQARLRVGGRLKTITFATRRLALAPLDRANYILTVAASRRRLLNRLHRTDAFLVTGVAGAAGGPVTIRTHLRLFAP